MEHAPLASDFCLPCPGCSGLPTTICDPGPANERYGRKNASSQPQKRTCTICRQVPGRAFGHATGAEL